MAGPTLNWEDLPEAQLPGGAGHKSRQLGYRPDRVRLRTKSLRLPLISEAERRGRGVEEEQAQTRACKEEGQSAAWSCLACTFLNCSLLPACEMCQTERNAAPAQEIQDLHNALGRSMMPPQEAACEESSSQEGDSWVHCEVSSEGSSWLDVDGTDVFEEADDLEASAVVVRDAGSTDAMPPAVLSWAARAKNIAGQGVAVKVPSHGTPMPPLWRTRTPKVPEPREDKAAENDQGEYPELVDTEEDGRVHPQVVSRSSSSTRCLRVARWRQKALRGLPEDG